MKPVTLTPSHVTPKLNSVGGSPFRVISHRFADSTLANLNTLPGTAVQTSKRNKTERKPPGGPKSTLHNQGLTTAKTERPFHFPILNPRPRVHSRRFAGSTVLPGAAQTASVTAKTSRFPLKTASNCTKLHQLAASCAKKIFGGKLALPASLAGVARSCRKKIIYTAVP